MSKHKFGECKKHKSVGTLMRVTPAYYQQLESLNWHKGVSMEYGEKLGRVLWIFHGSAPDHICLRMEEDGQEIGFPLYCVEKP